MVKTVCEREREREGEVSPEVRDYVLMGGVKVFTHTLFTHTRTYMYLFIYSFTYIYMYVYTHIYTNVYTNTHMYLYICIQIAR